MKAVVTVRVRYQEHPGSWISVDLRRSADFLVSPRPWDDVKFLSQSGGDFVTTTVKKVTHVASFGLWVEMHDLEFDHRERESGVDWIDIYNDAGFQGFLMFSEISVESLHSDGWFHDNPRPQGVPVACYPVDTLPNLLVSAFGCSDRNAARASLQWAIENEANPSEFLAHYRSQAGVNNGICRKPVEGSGECKLPLGHGGGCVPF